MSKKKNIASDKRLNLKLTLMEGLDEEIVDRNTEKRYMLLKNQKKRMNGKGWIPVLSAVACLCIIFGSIFWLFPRDDRQVPIYQGMTVSTTYSENGGETLGLGGASVRTLSARDPFFGLGVLNVTENYGELLSELLEQVDSFVESGSETEEVESETEKQSTLTDFSSQRYFAKPGQDIYITIHFSNPDKFEILSFTLNGEKFSSYMFEAGSDMEHLVLKQNVGSVCGLKEFTIDAIKYVDGTEIKDVRMDGDRTVEVGVYQDELPKVTAGELEIGFFDVHFDVTLSENTPTLLRLYEAEVAVALYQNEEPIEKRVLSHEEWGQSVSVVFEHLLSGRNYTVALEAVYDDQGGNGEQLYYFWIKHFRTEDAMTLEVLEQGQEHVKLGVTWNEEYPQKEFLSLLLLDENGELVREEPLTNLVAVEGSNGLQYEVTLTGLLSGNRKYSIAVGYANEQILGEVRIDVCTEAYELPLLDIANVTAGYTSISFEVREAKTMPLEYTIDRIDLLNKNDEVVATGDGTTRRFDGLRSGELYYICLYYSYDLHDGNGWMKDVYTVGKITDDNTPVFYVTFTDSGETSIGFAITEEDSYDVGGVTKIELLSDGTVIRSSTDPSTTRFDGLESNRFYDLRVSYTYNTGDDRGEITVTETIPVATAKDSPIAELKIQGSDVLKEDGWVTLIITMKDPNAVAHQVVINGVPVRLVAIAEGFRGSYHVSTASDEKQYLKCTEIKYETYPGGLRTASVACISDRSFLVQGTISVKSVTLSGNGIYVAGTGDVRMATVVFDGLQGYSDLTKMVLAHYGDVVLYKKGENTYSFQLPDTSVGKNDVRICEIEIHSVSHENGREVLENEDILFVLLGAEMANVTEIRTAAELQSMESGRAYRLMNDIDLAGFDWRPYDFDGVLYGNGFSIKNFSVYTYCNETDAIPNTGLFGKLGGYVADLTLENATVTFETAGAGTQWTGGSVGILAGCIDEAFLDQCTVKGSLRVIEERYTEILCGGVAGSNQNSSVFRGCTFEGSVYVNVKIVADYYRTGSLIGPGKKIDCTHNGQLFNNGQAVFVDSNGDLK